ncbi:WbqC family protein [Aestuariirhabdus sp. LZHN29]|uniref:WbqC family protein n=1 Tax=Aestuariirhabdus sp. LZHN29 TaxID=3417462 RepID=UPI003CF59DCC
MRVSVMQPYFIPYLGYWQMMSAADVFVVFDDVNYIKRGYVNRNSILLHGLPHLVTLQVNQASQNRKICELSVGDNSNKILETMRHAYSKAPYYKGVMQMMHESLQGDRSSLSNFLENSIKVIALYMGIETRFLFSSSFSHDSSMKGSERIIDIAGRLGANTYLNPIGGVGLYSKEEFSQNGIELSFLKMEEVRYPQLGDRFVPNLSIIDVLMFNDVSTVKELLGRYTLV